MNYYSRYVIDILSNTTHAEDFVIVIGTDIKETMHSICNNELCGNNNILQYLWSNSETNNIEVITIFNGCNKFGILFSSPWLCSITTSISMKTILILFVVFAVCFGQEEYIDYSLFDTVVYEQPHNYEEFIRGLLMGLGEPADPSKLRSCLRDGDIILERTRNTLETLKIMNVINLTKGLHLLLETNRMLLGRLEPCMADFHVLQRLFGEVKKADIRRLVPKILKRPAPFLHYVREAMSCYIKNNSHCVGTNKGAFIKLLFFYDIDLTYAEEESEAEPNFFEFTKGFLAGIKEEEDVNKLKNCLKNGDRILIGFRTSFEHSKTISFQNLLNGIRLMVVTTRQYLNDLTPCMKDFQKLKLLKEGVANPNITFIVEHLIKIPEKFLGHVLRAIGCYRFNDAKCVGNETGHILHSLFMHKLVKADPMYNFLKGFLLGIHEVKTVDDLIRCIGNVEPIIRNIRYSVKLMKHFTIINFVKGMVIFIKSMIELNHMIRPCLAQFKQVELLMIAISNSDLGGIFNKITQIPLPLLLDTVELVRGFFSRDHFKVGINMGDILYRVFLTAATDYFEFLGEDYMEKIIDEFPYNQFVE
eukprot:TRINITY_DN205_c1_g1_i1.p1 TRINITY_DN205_c1_g1~~TRINITY_DN205_c1_g1_i1.p1  ORF type:complete len:588 (-),score=52.20 TRINITY_DN205_c1_g1_i1:3719-5482(-)